jgi:hypothetical protein
MTDVQQAAQSMVATVAINRENDRWRFLRELWLRQKGLLDLFYREKQPKLRPLGRWKPTYPPSD